MNKKSQSTSNYLIINGWIAVILVLVLMGLYVFGIFDFFKYSAERCDLGDGFNCAQFRAETDEASKPSNGDVNDMVIIEIENELETTAHNLSIIVLDCRQESMFYETIPSKTKKTYIIKMCKGLKPKNVLQSDLEIRYKTIEPNLEINHFSKGHIYTHVISPAPEKLHERMGRSIAKWMRENVG